MVNILKNHVNLTLSYKINEIYTKFNVYVF